MGTASVVYRYNISHVAELNSIRLTWNDMIIDQVRCKEEVKYDTYIGRIG